VRQRDLLEHGFALRVEARGDQRER